MHKFVFKYRIRYFKDNLMILMAKRFYLNHDRIFFCSKSIRYGKQNVMSLLII